jgi:superfamily II DNA or RNA helicase
VSIHPSSYQAFIPFGKHKGKSFGFLAEMEPDYLTWLASAEQMPHAYRTAASKTLKGEDVTGLNLPNRVSPASTPVTQVSQKVDMWYIEKGQLIGVRFRLIGDVLDRFKATIDGRKWNGDTGNWEFPACHLPKAIEFFGGPKNVSATESVKKAYKKELDHRRELDEIRLKETSDLIIPTLLPLRPYQAVTVEFGMKAGGRFLIGHAPGLGKTASSIAYALMTGGKTLVVCPKSVKLQWAREILRFSGFETCVWDADGAQSHKGRKWHVINYDIVAKYITELNKLGFTNLICDEATKLKNYNSVRYKAIAGSWKERKKYPGIKSDNVLLLTGTPILNRPMELYTLLSFLDKKRFNNPQLFKKRYEGATGGQNLDELHERIKNLIIRYTKEKVRDELPKKSRTNLLIEMTPQEEKAYNKHLDELFRKWKLNGKPSAAHMPAIRDYLFELKYPRIIEWVDDMLDAGKSPLIFTVQQRHAEKIAAHYGSKARLIHGGVSDDADRQQRITDLCTQKAQVGVFTIIAGGMGIDGLQHVMSDVLFVDRWFVPADHEQAEDRLNRLGQKEATVNYYVTVVGTLDEDMAEILEEKQTIIDHAIDGIKPLSDQQLSKIANTSIFKEVTNKMVRKRNISLQEANEDDIEEVIG